ncbi:MAG TPA: 4-(cytidine 5'-diphospho)-2-C-methyl-D-erythritol kinase, partial [Tepidisphaeraceae bacterium]
LLSWMTTVGLFDTLTFEPTALNGIAAEGRVSLRSDMPGLPCDERNLIVRIANLFRNEFKPQELRDFDVFLEKKIPVGAGLGGGSSDAASALMALNRLWRTGGAANVLSAFAARIGSDLSFFFHGPSSVCRGRGEIVSPIARPSVAWAVLVLPKLSMPTPAVYQRFDQMNLGRDEDVDREPNWDEWTKLSGEELLPRLVNDLEAPAFDIAPVLGELCAQIERLLDRPVRMSGSGSSLFTLFDLQSHAIAAVEKIARDLKERAVAVELSPVLRDDLNENAAM